MNLLLVRHGEVLSNLKKVYAGGSTESLTERGKQQAYKVAGRLSSMNIHTLYTSPVKRAVETAEIIGHVIGKNYTIIDEFKEMEMGPWEGMSEEEIARLYPHKWQVWQCKPAELRLDGRETLDQVLARALKGLERISGISRDNSAVIVTHVVIIRVLLLWSQGKSLNLYRSIHIPNGGLFQINYRLKLNDFQYQ